MKKLTFFTIILVLLVSLNSQAQDEMLDGGFSLKFSFGFPPTQYGYDGDLPLMGDIQVNTTYGLEIGNQWYFLKGEKFGLGLDVNWFEILYSHSKLRDLLFDRINRNTLEGSFLEFGPVATFALNDMFAIEGYYNLRPTYMATWFYKNSDDYVILYNFNIFNAFGIGARFKFLYIGYEYTFGDLDGKLAGGGLYEDVDLLYDKQPMNAKNSKLVIGFQF